MTPCDNRPMAPHIAVSAGASGVQRLPFSLGHVTALRFAPNLTLPRHGHPQPTIAVILAGGFRGTYGAGERDCDRRTVVIEPAGEQHVNRFGDTETSILSLSVSGGGLAQAVESAIGRFRHERDGLTELIARRAARELARPDDVTPMAVEAAALELVSRVTRLATPERRPAWLAEARSVLHDRYADSLSLAEVAAAIGVEPERLARGFRRAFGEPMATYIRRLRVSAAADLLASTDLPIARIATDVGFADQSHLTRWFARYVGMTPGSYRARRLDRRGITAR
jgi:AraC family transcriptional regulator